MIVKIKCENGWRCILLTREVHRNGGDHPYWFAIWALACLSCPPALSPCPPHTVQRVGRPEGYHLGHCSPMVGPWTGSLSFKSSISSLYSLHLLVPILDLLLRLFTLFERYLTFNQSKESGTNLKSCIPHIRTVSLKELQPPDGIWSQNTAGMVTHLPGVIRGLGFESCPHPCPALQCHSGTHCIEWVPWEMKGLNWIPTNLHYKPFMCPWL